MSKLVRSHWVGIIAAIITGLIYVLPNLVFINTQEYKGLPIVATEDEIWYLSRINAVNKGCMLNCNPYIKEYGYNFPYFDVSVMEIILAIPKIVFSIPTIYLNIIYTFLLPLFLFLLFYGLLVRLTSNVPLSIIGSAFYLLGFNLLNSEALLNIPGLLDLVTMKSIENQFLVFSRPVNPQFSSIFFIVYLHILLKLLIDKNDKWFRIIAIFYGLLFYIYFFTYAFVTVIQGVFSIFFLFKKQCKLFYYFIFSTLIGLIIAMPQFIHIAKLLRHQYYPTIPTSYLIFSHIPDISISSIILLAVFCILSFIVYKKKTFYSTEFYFVSLLIVSCFITRNEHVISGMIMQYNHFDYFLFTPVLIIGICYFINSLFDQKIINKYLWIFFMIYFVIIYNSILIQQISYLEWSSQAIERQKFIPILNWLNSNVKKYSVVSAPEPLSSLIPIYTDNYVLWATYANQMISIPGRMEGVYRSSSSVNGYVLETSKYGVDYYVESQKRDFFKNSDLKVVYVDRIFVVYESNNKK